MAKKKCSGKYWYLSNVRDGTPVSGQFQPWVDLAGAVLYQAKEDYVFALIVENRDDADELEEFFLSRYGQILSFGQGEYIVNRCKEISAEYKRGRRRTFWNLKD